VDDGASLLSSSSVLHYSHGILCEFILIILSTLSTLDMIGLREWAGFEPRLFPALRIPVHMTFMSKNMCVSYDVAVRDSTSAEEVFRHGLCQCCFKLHSLVWVINFV